MMMYKAFYQRDSKEKKEKEDSAALKIACMHQYENSRTTLNRENKNCNQETRWQNKD